MHEFSKGGLSQDGGSMEVFQWGAEGRIPGGFGDKVPRKLEQNVELMNVHKI